MEKRLTVRFKILKDESISSYMFRVSKENGLSFLTFWNMIKSSTKDYAQFSEINILDIAPQGHIDWNSFKYLTGAEYNYLDNNSFSYILDKFYSRDKMNKARLIAGMFRYEFCYCPVCFEENIYSRLIWRVKDIKICDKHNIRLLVLLASTFGEISANNFTEVFPFYFLKY